MKKGKKKKMNKVINKKDNEELQMFLHYRKRAFALENKKGKGSYNRNDFKKGKN